MSIETALKGMGYTLIASIGEGTFSKVKLATSQRHSCNVAIKIIDRMKGHQDFIRKFLPMEKAILRRVNHKNIIQMYEYIEIAGRKLCIVMEAAAKDLSQKIQEVTRIPKDQSKAMFTQMVSAVNYLHQMEIVHRDLKCENILLTVEEQVKIADFGFARYVKDPSELSHTFCGTQAYSPPEVITGTPYNPKKYDVWSLGVVLYFMVTGTMPFNDSNIRRLQRLQQRPLVYPSYVDESWRGFISTLLQPNPSTRPTIQQVAEHPWMVMKQS